MKIDDLTKILSPIVVEQLPDYIKNDLDRFSGANISKIARFVQLYYEWLEKENVALIGDYAAQSMEQLEDDSFLTMESQSGNPYNSIVRLKSFRDIDNTILKLLEYFRREFAEGMPGTQSADLRRSIPLMKVFYESKGNEKSFQFLFRMLYNKAISISYPISKTITPSSRESGKGKYLRIRMPFSNGVTESDLTKFVGNYVVGEDSGAKAVVGAYRKDRIEAPSGYSGAIAKFFNFYEIEIKDGTISGTFNAGEQLRLKNSLGTTIKLADGNSDIVVDTLPGVSSASLSTIGTGYYLEDTITGSYGYGHGVSISSLRSSPITDITISNAGAGYSVGDMVIGVNDYFDIRNLENGSLAIGNKVTGEKSGATAIIRKTGSRIWVDDIVGSFITDEDGDSEKVVVDIENVNLIHFHIKKQYQSGTEPLLAEIKSVNGSGGVTGIDIVDKGNYTFPPHLYIETTSTNYSYDLKPIGPTLGSINKIQIGSPGTTLDSDGNHRTEMTIVSKSSPYVSATGSLVVSMVLDKEDYTGNENILSGESFVRDADYYQEFSYLIDVNVLVSEWGKIIQKMAHPGGMKYFGNYTPSETQHQSPSKQMQISIAANSAYLSYLIPSIVQSSAPSSPSYISC